MDLKDIDIGRINTEITDSSIIGKPVGNYGEYVPKKKIGQGAMGSAYLASGSVPYDNVVVKFLGTDENNRRSVPDLLEAKINKERAVMRFLREIETTRRANVPYCPNIVEIYDAGITQENRLYFVMEYVDGMTLRDVLSVRKGDLSLSEDLVILMQVLNALSNAHRQRIVHRDVKPENILIGDAIKLGDFGISYIRKEDTIDLLLTREDQTVGTACYMSQFHIFPPKISIDARKTQIEKTEQKEFCKIGKTNYEISRDDKGRPYIAVVSKHADISAVGGPLHFELLTGYNYFGSILGGRSSAEKLYALIGRTTAKDFHVDNSGAGKKSSTKLRELNNWEVKRINEITDLVWEKEFERACGSAEEIIFRIDDMLKKHKGTLRRKYGRTPTQEEVLEHLKKETYAAYTKRCEEIAETFNSGKIDPNNEDANSELIRNAGLLFRTRGKENPEIKAMLQSLDAYSKRVLARSMDKTLTLEEMEVLPLILNFHKKIYHELQKYDPSYEKNTSVFNDEISAQLGVRRRRK